jgi:hypothetical protein
MGVAIQAEYKGPSEIIYGICGPPEDNWNKNPKGNAQFYGEPHTFIGQDSRQRINQKIQLERQSAWWPQWAYLKDAAGQKISDWRDTKTLMRLYSEKEVLCEDVLSKMTSLAEEMSDLVIDAT